MDNTNIDTNIDPESTDLQPGMFTDQQLVSKFKVWHRESFDQRWVFERQWLRNIWYVLNRQWIYWDSKRGQWQDKRMAKWIPRPVTNVCKEIIQTVRANFAAINYGASSRPIGNDTRNVIAASVADDYVPVLHEDHQLDDVFNDGDFWMLTTGNVWYHSCVVYDRANGTFSIATETCGNCGKEYTSDAIANAGQTCPDCKAPGDQFTPSTNPDGSPKVETRPRPKGTTIALSPFEIAYPLVYDKFDEVPYVIRMRWRAKTYYEQHSEEQVRELAKTLPFGKMPSDRTMQIYKTLPFQNDLGLAPSYFAAGGSQSESEGITEYDVWVKPCEDFPEGQVIRFIGEEAPVVFHSELENLPGPLPYTDSQGEPIFTFTQATYDGVSGRSFGSGVLDPIIQKQDTLNQVDSMMLMIIMRMSNPIWLEPKGAEVERFTGEPGLVVKWNPLVGGGNAKPERIEGANIPAGLFSYRQLLKTEIEELSGTYDILKGNKPSGVEAYAAINLLLERGQARHTSAFKSRGKAYKQIMTFALEIERQFGDETRTRYVMAPTKGWALETFKRADLRGQTQLLIEDSTTLPKTNLGERANVDHLNTLGLLNPQDPDQVYKVYELFGMVKLLPAMDAQKQEAWKNMEQLESFVADPSKVAEAARIGVGPLQWRRWYEPTVHRQELINWCLSDRGRQVFETHPEAVGLVDAYLQEIDLALQMKRAGAIDVGGEMLMLAQQQMGQPQPNGAVTANGQAGPQKRPMPPRQGAGQAMSNSQQNAGGVGPQSSGSGGTAEPTGQAT